MSSEDNPPWAGRVHTIHEIPTAKKAQREGGGGWEEGRRREKGGSPARSRRRRWLSRQSRERAHGQPASSVRALIGTNTSWAVLALEIPVTGFPKQQSYELCLSRVVVREGAYQPWTGCPRHVTQFTGAFLKYKAENCSGRTETHTKEIKER